MQLPFQVTVNPGVPQPLTASSSMVNTSYVSGSAAPNPLAKTITQPSAAIGAPQ